MRAFQYLLAQDHATAASPLFIAVACVVLVGGCTALALVLMRNRFKNPGEQERLIAQHFDGRPEVYLNKAHWSIGEEQIRRIAHEHGYQPAPSPYRALAFRRFW